MRFRAYFLANIISLDALFNTLLRGRVGQTLSQRAATARRDNRRWGCWLCGLLDKLDSDHCAKAMVGDAERARVTLRDIEQ